MITTRTSPQYVNRVRQDWTANGGVYGDGGISALVPSNDPFAQLGPTLDLTFAGVPTDQLAAPTTDGYSINLNLSSEIYQIAAQYVVWGTGGLTQVNFADIVTFTRASNATQFDSTGSLVYAPVNLLLRSESLATTAVWFNSGLTSITNNTPNTVDPAGGNTATELVVAASAGVVGQNAVLSGVNHTGSVWLRCASGTVTGSLLIYLTASPFTNIGTQAITITTTWQRFSVATSSLPTAGTSYNFQIHNLSGGTVYAWGAQLNPSPILGGVTSSLSTYYPTTTAAYYGPRFDYNPSTLAAQGLLIEEARTNSIRNNTMQGAVAGTPGTVPTNWLFAVATTTGLTTEVVGTGTESGITYVDLKVSGTAVGAGSLTIAFEPNAQTVAVQNQVWTVSMYRRLMAGSFNGLTTTTTNIFLNSYTAVGVFDSVSTSQVRSESTPTSAALNTQRSTLTGTLSSATTARVNAGMFFSIANGAAIDITLRIGLPQLEQGAFATSVIPTTTTALTRSADVASVNTLSPWYNASAGTVYAEFLAGVSVATQQSVFDIDNSSDVNNNRISWRMGNEFVASAGSTVVNFFITPTASATSKWAFAFTTDDFAFSRNGGAPSTDPSGALPSGLDRMRLGSSNSAGTFMNGYLRRITYYPRRLSNADLQTLTT